MARYMCIVMIVLVGCSGASTDPRLTRQLAELDGAVEAWASGDRSDYSYIYFRTCKCTEPEPQGPNTVFVVDGSVDIVEHFGSREALEGFSAEALFDQIRQAINDGREIAVTYDQTSGLPSTIHLDLNAGPDDDPLILEIRSFLSYAKHRADLDDAQMRWQAASVVDYQINYEGPSTGSVAGYVRNGVVTVSGGTELAGRSVADFFDELDDALAARPDSITIEYDPELGYPTSYRIEQQSDRRNVIQYESIKVTT